METEHLLPYFCPHSEPKGSSVLCFNLSIFRQHAGPHSNWHSLEFIGSKFLQACSFAHLHYAYASVYMQVVSKDI